MRRVRKIVLRSGVGIGVLVIVVVIACLDAVDYTPYFQEPFYRETTERLRANGVTNRVVQGELLVGFGRARLTPEIGATADQPQEGKFRALPLAGYGNRKGHPATGVHDDLFVKAVALRVGDLTGIVFSSDALIVPREVADAAAEKIREEFGLERGQLYFSATHTHCSIGGWGEGFAGEAFAGEFNPGSRVWFVDRFVLAAREALAKLKPAEFAHGTFKEPRFVRNRLAREAGRVDTEFSFLALRQVAGEQGIIGSYAAHATVLSGRVMEFSGDYPGAWQRTVERANGGHALFVAGAVGSHGPVAEEGNFRGAESMGSELAARVVEKLKDIQFTNRVSFGIAAVEVSLPELNVRLTDGFRLRPWVSGKLLRNSSTGSFLQAFRLNEAIWVSTPCDFSGELALDLKDFLKVRGFDANITSFNGDYIGYVICPRYYHMNGYEPRVMSFYGPYVPDYLNDLIRSLALIVTR